MINLHYLPMRVYFRLIEEFTLSIDFFSNSDFNCD